MTPPDLGPRSKTLGVKLTEREKAAVMAECERRGEDASAMVRRLLREAGYLGDWSIERERPAQQVRRGNGRPKAHLYTPLVGKWVDMSRPANAIEQRDGGPERVGMAGMVAEVADSGGGVEIITDYGIGYWVGPDGDGWRFRIRANDPLEEL